MTLLGSTPNMKEFLISDPLDCRKTKDFWISIGLTSVSFGLGRIPGEKLVGELSYQHEFLIHAASVASINNHRARWIFYKDVGNKQFTILMIMFGRYKTSSLKQFPSFSFILTQRSLYNLYSKCA